MLWLYVVSPGKALVREIKEYTTFKRIEKKKNNKKQSIRMKARKRKQHRTDKTSGKNTVRYKFNSKYTSNSIKLK